MSRARAVSLSVLEPPHHEILLGPFHPAVDQAYLVTKSRLQAIGPFFRRSKVTFLAFFDQGTNPIGLTPSSDMTRKTVNYV